MFSINVADPGSGAFLTPWIRDGKKSVFRSESLETIFWVKLLKFFDTDLGSGMEKTSVADPCHFGVDPDPDPRIHASYQWIRILDPDPAIFVIDLQDANKN